MPTYEYECSKCNNRFEIFQKINDNPIEICPECGGKTERLISGGAGVNFKGSGFYLKDSGKKTPPAPPADSGCSSCRSSSCAGCKK